MAEAVVGMQKLLDQLDGMDKGLTAETLESALLAAARVVEDEARRRVPVRSGQLRDSIYSATSRSKPDKPRHTFARAGMAKVAAAAFYAGPVEYGTRHSRPRPFLRPALDAKEIEARAAFAAALTATLGVSNG